MKFLMIEHHPNDSREKLSQVCQALSSRMGTGGGNVPLVVMIDEKPDSFREQSEPRNDNK